MEAEAKNVISVTITMDQDTGEIQVNGPLQNEMMMYGLLEKARQITEAYTRRATAPMISRAPLQFPKDLTNLKN